MYPPEKPSAPALSGYPNPPPPGPVGYYPPMEKPMTQPPPPPPNVNYPNPPPPGPSGYPPPPSTNYPNPPPQGPQGGYPPPPFGQQAPMVQGIPVGGSPMNNPSPLGIQTPQPQAQQTGYWSTGLCDCFSDIPSCLLACFCPCVAFGRVSEIVDKGTSSCGCNGALYGLLCSLGGAAVVFGVPLSCAWIYSCTYRGKLKQDMNMPPSCCEDCCIHFCCEPCALAQEYRELQNRGYDLSLGWNGNVEKQRQQQAGNGMPAMVAAPAAPSMAR